VGAVPIEETDAGLKLCLDQGLMAVLDNATSRAHVLLMRNPQEASVLDVFDLCSTNGTYVEGQPARRIRVETAGATFVLGRYEAAVSVKVRFPPARS
jgi:pSer/pThr/pTyr-binding forkhead associated (FHA) protein